nr:hypothetical protein [Tanacetum cinerariifolium]
MDYRSVAIERLPFHEEWCNRVYFRGDDDVNNVIRRETASMSKFTKWMKANEMYPELGSTLTNRLIVAERMYNANEEWSQFTSLYGALNLQQRDVYDNIMQAVNERNGGLFFVYGCGDLADLIRVADLIIWDEAPVQHRHAFEAVDRTLGDIYRIDNLNVDNKIFDGKVVMLAIGDGRLSSIALNGEDDATDNKSQRLLVIFNVKPVGAIVSSIFLDLLNRIQDINWLKEKCIMSSTNDVFPKINSHVLASMSCQMHELLSADTICSTTDNLEDM